MGGWVREFDWLVNALYHHAVLSECAHYSAGCKGC